VTCASERKSDAEVLVARLDALAACTDEPGFITRLAFSPALTRANALALGWMRDAGMTARTDAAGNVMGRYEAQRPGAPALLVGSHLDSVRQAGKFDGPLGVLAATAVVERLRREQWRLPCALEVVGFADEEGVRFGGTALGSAAVAGLLRPDWRELKDETGVTAAQALSAFGLDPEAVGAASRRDAPPLAYLELHIEQGPALEQADAPLGCVTGIAGATRAAVVLSRAAAQGDTLGAVAECVLAVERICRDAAAVGTVGRVQDGASAAEFTIDIRSGEDGVREAIVNQLREIFRAIARARNCACEWRTLSESRATACSTEMIDRTGAVLREMGLPPIALPSGAGHDGIAMSAIAPTGMVFVRCAGGVSHHPAESVSLADIALGVEALYRLCVATAGAGREI
jgi:allantoate deiminase